MNNIDLAISNYEKAISLNLDDINIKKDLASCYHIKKNYVSALKYYDEILKLKPEDLDVKTNKAFALHALDQFEEAIVLYKEIIGIKKTPTIVSNLSNAYL